MNRGTMRWIKPLEQEALKILVEFASDHVEDVYGKDDVQALLNSERVRQAARKVTKIIAS